MARIWEEFKLAADVREPTTANASINPRGVISLNAIAWEALEKPEAVILLYDKLNRVIGLKPCHPRLDNAVPVRKKYRSKEDRVVIRAIALCRYYEITPAATLRFRNPTIDRSGTMELDLRDAHQVGLRGRPDIRSSFDLVA